MEEAAPVGVRDTWVGVAAFLVDRALGSAGVGYLCGYWGCVDGVAGSRGFAGAAQGWSEAGEGGLSVYFNFLKLKVDALSNPLIMRPTSSDIGTKNLLRFNKLDCSERVERATIE